MRTIVWFRGKDLRLSDHEPLQAAAKEGEVIPLFVLDPYFFAPERARTMPNRIHFLLESLRELEAAIRDRGSRLVVVAGRSTEVVPRVVGEWKVDRVRAHRWSEPIGIERDRRIAKEVDLVLHEGETLARPGQVRTKGGGPFAVFTPFSRAFGEAVEIGKSIALPSTLPPLPPIELAAAVPIPTAADLKLAISPHVIEPGAAAAKKRLAKFLEGPGAHYEVGRNELGHEHTSRLSQDLKFGLISPRMVWNATERALESHPTSRRTYLNEILWREFAYDVLRNTPSVIDRPFKDAWASFPYRESESDWTAWVEGKTGYPVVDAAARELLATGFVHNRARMIAASFLTKHLLLSYRQGEAHYMKWLTDGDWASNCMGWQWTAGCGVDASPWFRIFNPVLQGEKFDPDGAYVRRWVPELAKVPAKVIHDPSKLAVPGYPAPIVDHAFARKRFLAAAQGHLGPA